jgi:hypothetical protein
MKLTFSTLVIIIGVVNVSGRERKADMRVMNTENVKNLRSRTFNKII